MQAANYKARTQKPEVRIQNMDSIDRIEQGHSVLAIKRNNLAINVEITTEDAEDHRGLTDMLQNLYISL